MEYGKHGFIFCFAQVDLVYMVTVCGGLPLKPPIAAVAFLLSLKMELFSESMMTRLCI